ncbi:MAG: 3-oxoacyl-[acyl-carrier-protein] reductase [Holophagaceae bacterium]|jgi:3-oxoacyl-[acyl-carrier protein] reductase
MFSLQGKIAIVTGASQGIGESIANVLAHQGAQVIAVARNEANLKRTVEAIRQAGGSAEILVGDIAQPEEAKRIIDTVVQQYGTVHCLINNAGITKDKLMIQMKLEEWDMVLNTNLRGPFLMMQAATRPMMKQRWGRIVNIASVVGQMGNAGQANYVSAKSGLLGLTKTVARELGSRNITCNAVAPGYIESAMTQDLGEAVTSDFIKQIPLERFGQSSDVAHAVAFLCSDEAAYITGQTLGVNGGMFMA